MFKKYWIGWKRAKEMYRQRNATYKIKQLMQELKSSRISK